MPAGGPQYGKPTIYAVPTRVPQFTFGVFARNVNGISSVSTGILRFFPVFIPQKVQNRPKTSHFWRGSEAAVHGDAPHITLIDMDRRKFLATSVAAGAVGLGGRGLWPEHAMGQASPVDGVPKGLVSRTFLPLANALMEHGTWAPYPKPGDAKWSAVPQSVREMILSRADEVNASPWPEMLATDELEFKRNGNRSRFETISFGRRERLGQLVLGECISNAGKYLDQIANGVWLICEESFWGVPAHLGAQRAGVGLADVSEPIVELFGAETAATMAWVAYLVGAKLKSVSPRIVERIHLETKRRILDPYFTRNDFSWMGLDGAHAMSSGATTHHINNWNPWINSNVLTANLLLETDSERREAFVAKVCRSVDEFLADYSPDGGCEEGPGYWGRSAASFFDCCWTLVSAHGGAGRAVLEHPFTRAMGHYICNVHIAGNWYVNYGDAHPHADPSPDLSYRFGHATGDAMLAEFGAFQGKAHGMPSTGGVSSLSRTLAGLMVLDELAKSPAHDALPRDAWYPHLALMTAREKEGSAAGFYVACQAASNGRSHGHNDSGSFILFQDGQPVFIDVGPEAYTAKTFSKDRYTIWTMQSAYHNLPTIGGVMQHEGDAYRATDVRYDSGDSAATMRMNLAPAYPKQAGARRWMRTLTLDRAHSGVTIAEEFELERAVDVSLSLMTPVEPVIGADGVRIGRALLLFPQNELKATVERVAITDLELKHSWGDAVYRLKLNSAVQVAAARWKLEVRTTSS
jgi:hypothetical protein